MNEDKPIKLNTVPVTLLKRRKRVGRDIIKQQRIRSEELRKRAKKRRSQVQPPIRFIKTGLRRSYDELRLRRIGRRKSPILTSDQPRLGVVIRLKENEEQIADVCKDVFRLLRLDTYNQAVFIKITKNTLGLLNIVSPYVVWGYPSLQVVRDMVMKRGRTMLGKHRHSIDNKIIEEKLGKLVVSTITILRLLS
ncbi:60S ribosomal protein L7-1 [Schistosoma japonicum]|nr:60S ribosomal protein L7-1 [Schistosoma japonicum]